MTSIDRKIPKLFIKSVSFKVVRDDTSFFDTIPTYADWNITDNGFRDTLLRELKEFKEDHIRMLRDTLDMKSPMYTVAYASLGASVSWLEEFIRYMDETYNEYVESKFSSKKAWNITTRLARTLLSTIAEPRTGLSRSFRSRKPLQIKQAIFYSTLK